MSNEPSDKVRSERASKAEKLGEKAEAEKNGQQSSAEKSLRCGLVMPISAIDGCPEGHWKEIQMLIREALQDTPFRVDMVSDSNEVGIIQKRIVQHLYDCEMVVCDVSARNPNVMFELGMRLAFDKPAIIIKDDKTSYTFDVGQIEHVEYPRDLRYHSMVSFKETIKRKVEATYDASRRSDYTTFLKHFGQFKVAKIDEKNATAEEVLLEMMNELRQEVRILGRSRQRDIYERDVVLHSKRHQKLTVAEALSALKLPQSKETYERLKELDSPVSHDVLRLLCLNNYQNMPVESALMRATADIKEFNEIPL